MIVPDLRYTSFGQTLECSIREQCRILEISKSHFYDWSMHHIERAKKREIERELDFRRAMVVLDTWFPVPFLGYRKIAVLLANNGYKWSSDAIVRRLMKELGIYSAIAVRNTSIPGKGRSHTKYPYLLRDFVVKYVNQVWATDITYIALPHGFVYLCAVIDLYSRKVLSWKLSNTMDVYFCIECLEEALDHYGVPSIFNSDQGYPDTINNPDKLLEPFIQHSKRVFSSILSGLL